MHIPGFFKNRGFPYFDGFPIFQKGTEAVYVFFTLSGFLIIKQLYDEKKSFNSINLKSFYIRRALRIFPLYYLVAFIGFLYYLVVLPFFGFDFPRNYNLLEGILLALFFMPNVLSGFQPGSILEILWSIGVEEQFYILVAPLLLLIRTQRILAALVVFSILYFLLFFNPIHAFFRDYSLLFFYFSFGGLCAILSTKNRVKLFLLKIRWLVIGCFVFFFCSNLFYNNLNDISYHILCTFLFGLTLAVFSLKPVLLLDNPETIYLGKISYGIYMIHPIVIQLIGFVHFKFLSKQGLNENAQIIISYLLVIGVTIFLSHLSFKYYEGYFLRLKNRENIRRKV